MQEVAFSLLLMLVFAAFPVVPSAFVFRSLWRSGGARRYLALAVALLLAIVATGFSLSAPLDLYAQGEAWLAFFGLWLLLVLLVPPVLLVIHVVDRLRGMHRGKSARS